MPLAGSQESLGRALAEGMSTAPTYEEAWMKFAAIVIEHIAKNAIVVGIAQSGGGPIIEGHLE